MSLEPEKLGRIIWALIFAVGLIILAALFGSFAVLPTVLIFVLYFTLTKKA